MLFTDNSQIGAFDSNAKKILFCLTLTKKFLNKSQNEKQCYPITFLTRLFVHSFVR